MSWEWSHSSEAYDNARANLSDLPHDDLSVIYAEWTATDADGNFDNEAYGRHLAYSKQFATEILVDAIWERAEVLRTCDNGGHNAWVCPHGCHTVSFNREES